MPWKCPLCGFILHRMLLRASDMAIGINMSISREVCPNDGATLIPMENEEKQGYEGTLHKDR
mgnify:CR=1 FL=1